MNEILRIIPVVLYLAVGIISLLMAVKLLFSKKFLPFHEAAYGKNWEDVDLKLQPVIIALMKISGLGFLMVAILLSAFLVYNYFMPDSFLKYSIPLVALFFCTGLFIINYNLFKISKAETPWKKSLYAMIIIIISIVISSI
jgi:hypothetical protein